MCARVRWHSKGAVQTGSIAAHSPAASHLELTSPPGDPRPFGRACSGDYDSVQRLEAPTGGRRSVAPGGTAWLRVSRSSISSCWKQLGAGVAVTDGDGVLVRWNEHAERILGIPAAEAIGRPWNDVLTIMHGADVAGSEIQVASRTPEGWYGRALIRVPGPREVWVRTHVRMVMDAVTGSPTVGIAVFWEAQNRSSATSARRPSRTAICSACRPSR